MIKYFPIVVFLFLSVAATPNALADTLETNFQNPPREAGVRCWWWWLNSNVTKESITRDLEEMHKKGFSGAMIFDAGTELRWGPDENPPNGPQFGGPEWTELYLHALQEAKRLGLKIGLSIQSGWNLGGPRVTLDDTAKQITWSEIQIKGGQTVNETLPTPKSNYDYYRDISVLAWPTKTSGAIQDATRQPIRDLTAKSGAKELGGSAPDCRFLLDDFPSVEGEEDARLDDVVDIGSHLDEHGVLTWEAPDGDWTVMRIGYTPTTAHVATSSDNWKGHVLDYLSKESFLRYWHDVVDPLLQVAGPMAGTVLTQLETDSWECGGMNWSPGFAEDFERYNGYDPIRYLPIVAGKIIEDRRASNAFLADLRKTIAHCVSENHYKTFAEQAARYGIGIQPECSGPHAAPIDGITNYSHSEITMSEFWIPCPHRPNPPNRFFVKQAASAAHIYGKQLVGAESFTSLKKPHWGVEIWHDMKPHMDYEFCEGLNLIFFHTFTCSPKEMGVPGQEYFAGTHVNPQVTWWDQSGAFIDYINRVQTVLQPGEFVADVLYYYGDHVPNIAVNKGFNQAGSLPGYDYDVTNEEVLLQLEVVEGEVVVPSGLRYRVLVLPDHKVLSLAALEKVAELLERGATVVGSKPDRLVSLVGGDEAQERFHELASELWGEAPGPEGTKKIGSGRLVWGLNSRELLQRDGVPFDFEALDVKSQSDFETIHYTVEGGDVYFVSNQTDQPQKARFAFRAAGRQPELWDPVTGEISKAGAFEQTDSRTILPIEFNPYGASLVFFRQPIPTSQQGSDGSNFPTLQTVEEIDG
ncbi:MAG: glycoside hydrolase, partial [Candidatus Omnitrophica bacterium]|nr:glycoside hydrolase [Candidatus Omnitrophota bacterium]